jgi:hypothetical protein
MNDYFSPETREGRKAAFREARALAAGKSRDEVRELYLADLRARDISPPPGDYLEMDVTRIISASARNAGQGAEARGRPTAAPRPLSRLLLPARAIKNAGRIREQLLPQYQPGRDTKYIYPDRAAEPIQVVLEPGAAQWLEVARNLPRGADPASRVDVWLDFGQAGNDDRVVRVHIRDYLVGVLLPDDGDQFRAELEDAQRGGYFLMTCGFIANRDDSTGFYVYRFASD